MLSFSGHMRMRVIVSLADFEASFNIYFDESQPQYRVETKNGEAIKLVYYRTTAANSGRSDRTPTCKNSEIWSSIEFHW